MNKSNFQSNENFTKISKPKVKSYRSNSSNSSFSSCTQEKNSWKEIRRKNSKRNFEVIL